MSNTQPTNIKYPAYPQQKLNQEAYPAASHVPAHYYAAPAPVQYMVYAPVNGVAQPVIYPAMPQMGAIEAQEVSVQPLMAPVPQAPQPATATTSLMDRKYRIGLLVLGIISFLAAGFFSVYLPIFGDAKGWDCYYSSYGGKHCYRVQASTTFLGFSWTTVVTFIVQAAVLLGMFAAKNPNGLRVTLIFAMMLFTIFALLELVAAIICGIHMYYLYWDAMTVHIATCLISVASVVVSFVVHRKLFVKGPYALASNAPTTPLAGLAASGFIVSVFTVTLGTTGLVLTGVFFLWSYSTVASLMYISCGIIGIVANAVVTKQPKLALVLFRINTVVGWMLAGTGFLIGSVVIMFVYIPWASVITFFLAAWPAANAVLSMILAHKMDRQAAATVAPAPAPAETAHVETEADNVGLISEDVKV